MSQIVPKITPAILVELRELEKNSTQVVGWYSDYGGQIRGPFNRWFNVTEVADEYKKHCGSASDDARFAAAAMNAMPALLDYIQKLEEMLALEEMLGKDE